MASVEVWKDADNSYFHGMVDQGEIRLWGPDGLYLQGLVSGDGRFGLVADKTPFADGTIENDAITFQDHSGAMYRGSVVEK